MKIFNKLISLIYFFIIGAISLWITALPFELEDMFGIDSTIRIIKSIRGNYIYSLLGIVIFLLNLMYLVSMFKNTSSKNSNSFLVLENEYGEIFIYEETIIGLIDNIAQKFIGIEKIKTRVKFIEGKINLSLKGEVSNEVNIPEISKSLQVQVKTHIEEATGADVNDIKIEILNVTTPINRVK